MGLSRLTSRFHTAASVLFLVALYLITSSVVVAPASALNVKNEALSLLPKEIFQPMKPKQAPEIYGPTPANAQLGNQGLSVQLRKTGTVSVFAWPRPSMYDQVKMHTSSREDGRLWGASENAGLFLGFSVQFEDEVSDGTKFCANNGILGCKNHDWYKATFLRDWTVTKQEFTSPLNDVVVTKYRNSDIGLEVTVKDLVPLNENVSAGKDGTPGSYADNNYLAGDEALDGDALIRRVTIDEIYSGSFDGKNVRLFSFSNFNMVNNHHPYLPTADWAEQITDMEDAYYDGANNGLDAIYHFNQDRNSSERHQIIASAFGSPDSKHRGHVGYDNIMCTNVADFDCWANFVINGSLSLVQNDAKGAYSRFTNDDRIKGKVWTNNADNCPTDLWGYGWCPTIRNFFTSTGLQSEKIQAGDLPRTERVIFTASRAFEGSNDDGVNEDVKSLIADARGLNWSDAVEAKEDWYRDLLDGAPIPDANDDIEAVSKRALVTLVQNYDPRSGIKSDGGGAIVASVARQSPYGEDWPRDGYYFNYVLDHQLGLHDWVEYRNEWYADLQQKPDDKYPNDFPNQPLVPNGNWAMNYYGNGVEGGIIPWEIDETGYMLGAFWDHFEVTSDRQYLRDMYPAIKRSADFLVKFKDPNTNLQRKAHEDDHITKSQTMVGAQSTWMGLDAAVKAAEELGKTEDAERYRKRRKELGKAIDGILWNEEKQAWGQAHSGIAEIVWPVRFRDYTDNRVQEHLKTSWKKIEPTFNTFKDPSEAPASLENDQGVVTGLYETKFLISLAKAEMYTGKVKMGLEQIADDWATEGTYIMGEVWMKGDDTPFGNEPYYTDDQIVTTVSQPHAWEQCLFYLAAINTYNTSSL